MNLREFQEVKKTKVVKKALKEHYETSMDFDKLSLKQTRSMLSDVTSLLKESREQKSIHKSHESPAYLKLVMMEQALSDRLNQLKNYGYRLVVENEEVQKSQVILAAQDMIDSVQKMVENVSKMNVEELVAVVDGMRSEFGSEVGEQFNSKVGETLTQLQSSLTQARETLQSALSVVTGDEVQEPDADLGDDSFGDQEVETETDEEFLDSGDQESIEDEEEEQEDFSGAGRERR